MALALNNLKRVDMPLNKETKPNLEPFNRVQTNLEYYFELLELDILETISLCPNKCALARLKLLSLKYAFTNRTYSVHV